MLEEKLLKIINHYGVMPQLRYFQSEIFELDEAIVKYENEIQYCDPEADEEFIVMLKKHIAEEIADCFVMLEQFVLYYYKIIDDLNVEPYYFKTDNYENINDVLKYLKDFQQNIFDFNCELVILEDREQDYIINYQYENMISKFNAVIYKLVSIKEYYHIDKKDILRIMNEKVDRQLDRIANKTK